MLVVACCLDALLSCGVSCALSGFVVDVFDCGLLCVVVVLLAGV